ncbi:hypothetical protein [Microterricola viridarii]|uniref:Lipoprotein n=1 Tax=Microterricola viridarii TaxID=412690 RepID=A0A109QX53_9MICO|nr:hypothetical protein [Microterricola viridarii]AMB57725.1 hypothetical protein AWU67_01320 [Microterricola viridarii]
MTTTRGRTVRLVAVALAAGLALLIAGCSAPQPQAGQQTAPTSTKTPRPTPTTHVAPVELPSVDAELLAHVSGFVIRPDVLELRDDDGDVVTALSYMAAPAEAIAVLSTVFGEAPADEEYPGTNHTPPGVTHSWGSLVLDERFYDEQRRIDEQLDYLVWPRFAVYFDGPASGEIPMSTIQGIQAGDSWDFASSSPGFQSELYTCIGTPVDVIDVARPDGGDAQSTVIVIESDDATVRWVRAPEMVTDGCA